MKYHIKKEENIPEIAYCGRKITDPKALLYERNLENPDGSPAYHTESEDPVNDIYGLCVLCLSKCYNVSVEIVKEFF